MYATSDLQAISRAKTGSFHLKHLNHGWRMFACWLDTLTREKLVDGWKNKLWHVVSFSFNEIHSITSIVWRATAIADMTFWSGRVFWKRQATLPPVVTGGRQEFSGAKIRGPNITGEIFHVQIFIFPQIFFHAQIFSRADFFASPLHESPLLLLFTISLRRLHHSLSRLQFEFLY